MEYHSPCLNPDRLRIINSIKRSASILLDVPHRFKYFTLHGTQHIDNMLTVLDLLIDGGLVLKEYDLYLLICAICVHDLGMVTKLFDSDYRAVVDGSMAESEPQLIEDYIRANHHELIDSYADSNFNFLVNLGVSVPDISLIISISRCHRRVDLHSQVGLIKPLGALLRLIDELDIYSSRAPISVLLRDYKDMDSVSCWHWFKHNICYDWCLRHNVFYEKDKFNCIRFELGVCPTSDDTIPYWLTNIIKPINKALINQGVGEIISEEYGLKVDVVRSAELSVKHLLNEQWQEIEEKALLGGGCIILVVDDEARKIKDLFLHLSETYHIVYASNAREGLEKMKAYDVSLAIVDLQIGSGGLWGEEETSNYKMTGLKICEEFRNIKSDIKIGVLTGSRYDTSMVADKELVFFLKKPIDPQDFEREVNNVLGS